MKKLLLLIVFLAGCAQNIPIETGPPIEVFFCPRDNCEEVLIDRLDSAESSKCALYSVRLPNVLEALKRADWITEDGRSPLMHNKFCVFDEKTVLTGSWNPTSSKEANNVVIIHSLTLAKNYLDEFAELPGGYRRVRHPKISYNNRIIENYFCPEDDCAEHVLTELSKAKREIVFLLSWFTDEDIRAMLLAKRKSIDVKGVIDSSQKEALELLPFAVPANVHHKLFIIDGQTVITGSYNPTKSGNERNDENILIIHDYETAQKFLKEYNHLIS